MKVDGFPRAPQWEAAKGKPAPWVMKKDYETSTRIPFEQKERIKTPPGGKFTELQARGQAQPRLSPTEVFRTPPDAIREFSEAVSSNPIGCPRKSGEHLTRYPTTRSTLDAGKNPNFIVNRIIGPASAVLRRAG
jgi:hypothetical protein